MNKIFLSGLLWKKPDVKFTENFATVKFSLMDEKNEKYECFAIDGPAFWLAGLAAQKQITRVSVYGKLCNYRYYDAANTMHKSKYILVYVFEEGDTVPAEIDNARAEQINEKMNAFLQKGYAPISKIEDSYVKEV